MKKLRVALVLLSNAMLLGLPLLIYLDQRNPYYHGGFLSSPSARTYLLFLFALCLMTGILSLADLLDRWR